MSINRFLNVGDMGIWLLAWILVTLLVHIELIQNYIIRTALNQSTVIANFILYNIIYFRYFILHIFQTIELVTK